MTFSRYGFPMLPPVSVRQPNQRWPGQRSQRWSKENGAFLGKAYGKAIILLGWHYHYHYPIIIIILSLSLSYLLIQWIGLRDDLQETHGFYH